MTSTATTTTNTFNHRIYHYVFCLLITSILLSTACVSDNDSSTNGQSNGKPKTDNSSQPKASTSDVKPRTEVPTFNADSAFLYVKTQTDFGPRTPGSKAQKECADWMKNTMEQWADKVIVQEDKVKMHDGKVFPMYNIISSFNPQAEQRVLLCAHWDSRPYADMDADPAQHNVPISGANDGASGVGVLMEIARQLKQKPANIGIDIIFFDLEDYGISGEEDSYCLGSQYWGKKPHVPGYKAQYGILLDMVGAGDATFLKEVYSLNYAPSVVRKVWNVAAELGYSSYFQNRRSPGPITDDHYYVNTLTGIPTIDIIHYTEDGFGDFWHTHKDDITLISKSTLAVVGQTVMTVIYREGESI